MLPEPLQSCCHLFRASGIEVVGVVVKVNEHCFGACSIATRRQRQGCDNCVTGHKVTQLVDGGRHRDVFPNVSSYHPHAFQIFQRLSRTTLGLFN